MIETEKLYSMADVVHMLNIPYHKLYYQEYQGKLPTARRAGRCRVYNAEDIAMIKKHFAELEKERK